MRPSYIILIESGERLDLANAHEFNPNEYAWIGRNVGFSFCPHAPNESYCFSPDYAPDYGLTDTAHTVLYRAYDSDGHLVCEDTDHVTMFWL